MISRRTRFFLLCVLIAGGIAAAVRFADRHATIISGYPRVVDGDSIFVGESEIRLFGIDAPELDQICTRASRSWQCGAEAAAALRAVTAGRRIVCRARDRDRYGRTVAVCHAGEVDLGAAMIRRGFAVAYGAYDSHEREAREARRGIWSSSFDPPAVWRTRHPPPEPR